MYCLNDIKIRKEMRNNIHASCSQLNFEIDCFLGGIENFTDCDEGIPAHSFRQLQTHHRQSFQLT